MRCALLSATLDGLVISRPEPTAEQPQHLCLDAAYNSTPVYRELLARQFQPHVRSRGEEKRDKEIIPDFRARRWVVERTFAWLTQYRRLAKDHETLPESSEALIYLAMTRLMIRRLANG
jgi:putative transposase